MVKGIHHISMKCNIGEIDRVKDFGFEYMGFSNVSPNKLIIISSQKETVFDCDNKSLSEIEIDIDDSCISGEGYLNPVCHALPGTIIT